MAKKKITPQISALTGEILESISDGVFTVDGHWVVTSFNRAAEEITGVSREEAIGKLCSEVFRSSMCEADCALKHTLKTGKQMIGKSCYIIDVKGQRIPISVSTAVLKDARGRIIGGAETFRDLTELEELRLELKGRSHVGELVSRSPLMQRVFEVIPAVAASPSTVLILGETGTGKEVVARTIHALSPRHEGPFIAVNCGALPDTLLESELFGYKSGAFTGARKEGKPGLFEVANKGTLFLDEVESMPMLLQSKLLRVLQNFEITRVGGTKPTKVEVRLICASNQDLKDMVSKKLFRADLYYRLNVIPIYIPPLRERRDDIPYLVHFFLSRYNKKHSTKKVISKEAMDHLLTYSWPGNVREVANVIERLVVITHGDYIMPNNLPKEIFEKTGKEFIENGLTLKEQLDKIEISIIRKAIEKYGSARKAAPHLGMDSTSLTRKLKKYS